MRVPASGLRSILPLGLVALLIGAGCGYYDDGDDAPIDARSGCGDCDAPNFDASPDAADVCGTCTADQVCVQYFNGTCGIFRTACEPRVAECPSGTSCTDGCNQFQCNRDSDPPFLTCHSGGCAGERPDALHCYGP